MEFLYFTLVLLGVTLIITRSSIFEGFRNFSKRLSPNFFGTLFSCPMCLSFWVSVFLSFFINPFDQIDTGYIFLDKLFIGSLGSFICTFIILGILDFFYSIIDFLEKDNQ